MNTFTVGSLFAGIGGFDLGLERTGGFKTVWQVEIDSYARRVLAKHWPDVRRWDDVRTFPPEPVDEWRCDLICGGFPCQDISNAGKRAGIDGERSGLWSEYIRVVRTLRPRYVLVENVAALLGRGMGRVLGDLAASGYDSEWDCLSAAYFGPTFIGERVFILATASQKRLPADLLGPGKTLPIRPVAPKTRRNGQSQRPDRGLGDSQFPPGPEDESWARCVQGDAYAPCCERGVRRAAHGVSGGMDRIGCLGNAVVPQVAEWIGRRIIEVEKLNAR